MKTNDQILKIKAVVLYILQQLPEGLDYIHLFKTMYFAHQEHLVTYGLPLIDDTFTARKHGPVPAFTYKVLRALEGKCPIDTTELQEFVHALNLTEEKGHQIVTAKNNSSCDMDELSLSDITVLNKWIEKCKNIDTFNLSDLSHDSAWRNAKRQSDITGEDIRMTQYNIAQAGGASKEMLAVITERQNNKRSLSWI